MTTRTILSHLTPVFPFPFPSYSLTIGVSALLIDIQSNPFRHIFNLNYSKLVCCCPLLGLTYKYPPTYFADSP